MTDPLHFTAEIIKVQTTVDHAFRLTVDLPETECEAAKKLMEAFQAGARLEVAVIAIKND